MTMAQYEDGAIQPAPPVTVTDYAEIDQLIMGAPPAAQFKDVGALVTGKILRVVARQATDFTTKEPKWWPDGAPQMEPVITLESADGPLTLYAGSRGLRDALREACRQAGAGLRPGGTLAVRYTGDGTPSKPGMAAPKAYDAAYDPPGPVLPAPRPGPTYAARIEEDRSRVSQMVTAADPPF